MRTAQADAWSTGMATPAGATVRRSVRVRGTVQGVGFRPAVCRFATTLSLSGFVRNDADGVDIEIEGAAAAIARFVTELASVAPAVARIDSVETRPVAPRGELEFRIVPSVCSGAGTGPAPHASIPADLAPCALCLAELHDPEDRRYQYPFINCTACGPRFTIVRAVPYDRGATTMAPFALCADCRREYDDPTDRRHHAEPNACPACGPQLALIVPGARPAMGEAALARAVRLLRRGGIVAIKAAGGFVLAVDAGDLAAVARLRARKRRPDKPFAVMARSLADLQRIVHVDAAAEGALASAARPIVLARARRAGAIAANVAPWLDELGVFLPATPLQHLLFSDGPRFLVMTSGNLSEEPIAADNAEAQHRLGSVADAFLLHDREIHARADDSVVRVIAGRARVTRRARGFVPDPLPLPYAGPSVLAVGGELKATICLTRDKEAILSQHLGDLDNADGFAFFEETVARLEQLVGCRPAAIAHDLHDDYRTTRWARSTALPRIPVQHHHAHIASCMVEHGRTTAVLGVAFDGTGLGPDRTLWGGEFMIADLSTYHRVAHLRPLPLLGGEAAVREPWRLGAAAMLDAGEALDLFEHVAPERRRALEQLWARPHLSKRATGAGRWFDAVAALCGLRTYASYDGQAAIELEALASAGDHPPYEVGFAYEEGAPLVVDLRPTIRAIAADLRAHVGAGVVAARFHRTLAHAIAVTCRCAREQGAPETVALSGGCFQNRRLTELAVAELEGLGFEVLLHERVPCNDGGLALGQAAVASFCLANGPTEGPPCA
jgi:hydrogenase maturation protein HypF